MNVTFIVGNGFDLSMGMKTSYRDFYKYYCALPSDSGHIEQFKNSIKFDGMTTGENWADFELGLGKYTEEFQSPNSALIFLDCYQDAQRHLSEYMMDQDTAIPHVQYNVDEASQLGFNLLNFYHELSPREQQVFNTLFESDKNNNTVFNFISLNYTSALDRFVASLSRDNLQTWDSPQKQLKAASVNPEVCHAHGRLTYFPIIGVSDSSQIANKSFLNVPYLAETMIKSRCVDAMGQLWYEDMELLIKKSSIICIYGTSLGKTDGHIWKTVVEWLLENNSRHVIVFWYTKDAPNNIFTYKQLALVGNVRELLLSFSDIPEKEKRKLISQIHIIFNTQTVLRGPIMDLAKTK